MDEEVKAYQVIWYKDRDSLQEGMNEMADKGWATISVVCNPAERPCGYTVVYEG